MMCGYITIHRNLQLQAFAYAQGSDIHMHRAGTAPSHEAWHVVQPKTGRVQPTMQLQGVNVNDNEGAGERSGCNGRTGDSSNYPVQISSRIKNEKTVGSQMIQRQDHHATVVWGITHEVIPDAKGSLFGEDSNPFENEGIELHKNDKIVIDDEIIFQSRRGANQRNRNTQKR